MKILLAAYFGLLMAPVAFAQTKVEHLNPPTIHSPKGYSHVVIVHGGVTVYIAGQVPLDAKGNLVGAGDLGAQSRQAFENLKNALTAAGVDFSDVVSLTTYVTDMSKIDSYRQVRGQYLRDLLPASTLVEVKSLFRPEVMIEISAIAVRRQAERKRRSQLAAPDFFVREALLPVQRVFTSRGFAAGRPRRYWKQLIPSSNRSSAR